MLHRFSALSVSSSDPSDSSRYDGIFGVFNKLAYRKKLRHKRVCHNY